jgi:mannose-6-phosphate isomerase-like protein (cupin superfamily)
MPKLYFASPRDLPTSHPQPGVTERTVIGERTTVLIVDLDARTIVETHKHDVEHAGVVMRGSIAMVIAGEQRILTVGDTYVVPAGSSHGTRVLEQAAQVVDVFIAE